MTNDSERSNLRAGELARHAHVSRDTLRYYERMKLLPKPQRLANGYRCYAPAALARIKLIRAALGIGFTVDELKEILAQRDRGEAPCKRVHELALQKAQALESRIAELKDLQRTLRKAIRTWEQRLQSTAPGKRAGLLELFVASNPQSIEAISPMISPGLQRKIQNSRGIRK
ncbi:MAG TPA: MerR family transcriptional regulator [Candidatus Limnocylindrales bacterium]|jgi:DNA-binding transcriptional MerR regulator|nr:MerR family transcriptional regulator [Candidatus Limnocylindrales bacterium]